MAERRSDQIERDIARTRAEMSETIEALERRLSPGQLVDELWSRVRDGETASNFGGTIRDHPVPLALMGLGLGWLAIESATGSRTEELRSHYVSGEGSYGRAEGRIGPYRGGQVIDPHLRYDGSAPIGDRLSDTAERVKDRVTEIGTEVRDRLGGASEEVRDHFSAATESVRERMHEMSDRMKVHGDGHGGPADAIEHDGGGVRHLRDSAGVRMEHARETMHRRGSQLDHTFHSLLSSYPLALGAITFGLGLAAGASAPTTGREDRLMGDAADSLKQEMKGTVRETAQRARDVADEAFEAARRTGEPRSSDR